MSGSLYIKCTTDPHAWTLLSVTNTNYNVCWLPLLVFHHCISSSRFPISCEFWLVRFSGSNLASWLVQVESDHDDHDFMTSWPDQLLYHDHDNDFVISPSPVQRAQLELPTYPWQVESSWLSWFRSWYDQLSWSWSWSYYLLIARSSDCRPALDLLERNLGNCKLWVTYFPSPVLLASWLLYDYIIIIKMITWWTWLLYDYHYDDYMMNRTWWRQWQKR